MLAGVAPDDLHLLPRDVEHLGGDARQIEQRMRAEIADAALDVQLAVRPDRHQRRRGRSIRELCVPDGDADAANLDPAALPGRACAFVPVEELGAPVERLLHERARHVPAPAVFGCGGPNGALPSGALIVRIAT